MPRNAGNAARSFIVHPRFYLLVLLVDLSPLIPNKMEIEPIASLLPF